MVLFFIERCSLFGVSFIRVSAVYCSLDGKLVDLPCNLGPHEARDIYTCAFLVNKRERSSLSQMVPYQW